MRAEARRKTIARAYVLIDAEPGQLEQAVAALRGIRQVVAADAVIGPYDIVALIEMPDPRDIGRLVITEIHGISGIKRTTTCLPVH
jgi:DNA-binding Lrp family transcriptional regulator